MPINKSFTFLIAAALCACGSTEADPKNPNAGAGGTGGSADAGGGGTSSGGTSSGGTSSGGTSGGGTSSGGTSGGGTDGGSAGSAAGGASGGAPPDGGAGSGPSGVIGTVGTTCSPPGALACAGNYQKLTVVCGGDGTWQPNQTCETGEFCDSTAGPNAGTCRPQLPECAAGPGTRFCADRRTATVCGQDTVSSTIEQCNCWVGQCIPEDTDPCAEPEDFATVASCAVDCELVGCATDTACPANDAEITQFPAVFRVSQEQVGEMCRPCVDSQLRPNAIVVTSQTRALRVTVLSPWRIGYLGARPGDFQPECASTAQCLIVGAGTEALLAVTSEDPEAPARNVLIEEVEPGVECP